MLLGITKVYPDPFKKQAHGFLFIHGLLTSHQNRHPNKHAYYYIQGIMPLSCPQQTPNKFHGYASPWPCRDWKWTI